MDSVEAAELALTVHVARRKAMERKMLKAGPVVTIACVAILSVGRSTGYAQEGQATNQVAEPAAPADRVGFMKLNVDFTPSTSWSVTGGRSATGMTISSDRSLQTPRSNRSRARARSKTRIVAGAIAGAVGGFFAGGFLGAHIEGDRCDCDDPGVRGFLIGAPIGAVAGAIAGAKFLF